MFLGASTTGERFAGTSRAALDGPMRETTLTERVSLQVRPARERCAGSVGGVPDVPWGSASTYELTCAPFFRAVRDRAVRRDGWTR